jgi:dihydroorotase
MTEFTRNGYPVDPHIHISGRADDVLRNIIRYLDAGYAREVISLDLKRVLEIAEHNRRREYKKRRAKVGADS